MKGVPIPEGVAETAREMRAAGDKVRVIAKELGASISWVSKVCIGINPGQRSRFDNLNKIDVAAFIKHSLASGHTDREIAAELNISGGFVSFLRRKNFGHKPRSALHADKIAELLQQGVPARAISDAHGVSVSTVRCIAARRGIKLPQPSASPTVPRPLLSLLSHLDKYFSYDHETGVILKDGEKIGYSPRDYLKVSIKGRHYSAHRLAWLMYYREEPPAVIDHADGNSLNNRIANLRGADWYENAFNRKLDVRNKTGVKGVSLMKNGRYRASVQAYGSVRSFEAQDLETARKTRQRLAEQMHGEFVRHA